MRACFVDQSLKGIESIILDGAEFQHLVLSARVKQNDQILVLNGKGESQKAYINQIHKKSLELKVIEDTYVDKSLSSPKINIALAKIKKDDVEYVLSSLGEYWVHQFLLIDTDFVQKNQQKLKDDRIQTLLINSIKQSNNHFLPLFVGEKTLSDFIAETQSQKSTSIFVFNNQAPYKKSIFDYRQIIQDQEIWILIGPEGGWSKAEIELFDQKKINSITLNAPILRAKNAVFSGLSLLQEFVG